MDLFIDYPQHVLKYSRANSPQLFILNMFLCHLRLFILLYELEATYQLEKNSIRTLLELHVKCYINLEKTYCTILSS